MTWPKPPGWDERVETAQTALGLPADGLMGPRTADAVARAVVLPTVAPAPWRALSEQIREEVAGLAQDYLSRHRRHGTEPKA